MKKEKANEQKNNLKEKKWKCISVKTGQSQYEKVIVQKLKVLRARVLHVPLM